MKKLSFAPALILFLLFTYTTHAQDSTAYSDYYGTYKLPEGSDVPEVTIVWQDSALNITSNMGSAKMEQLGVDSFHMDYQDGTIKFVRDSVSHKVNALIIYVQGVILESPKIETATGTTTGSAWLRRRFTKTAS